MSSVRLRVGRERISLYVFTIFHSIRHTNTIEHHLCVETVAGHTPYGRTDKVAVKIVDRGRLDTRALRMLSREVSTLECVHHPNILR